MRPKKFGQLLNHGARDQTMQILGPKTIQLPVNYNIVTFGTEAALISKAGKQLIQWLYNTLTTINTKKYIVKY